MSRRNRLRHFIRDGIWATLCEGFAESNFAAFAIRLSASSTALGVLASSQSLLGCWLQLWSERLVWLVGSRKRLVLGCVLLQCAFLGAMVASVCFGVGALGFMALCFGFTGVGSLNGAIWSSWVSELLPARRRGFCLGLRSQRTHPANFAAVLVAGLVLQQVVGFWGGDARAVQIGFVIVFGIGFLAKCLSLRHLAMQPEGRLVQPLRPLGPMAMVSSAIRDPALRRMTSIFVAMGFAVNLSGPFHTPYLLESLHLSFTQFSFVTAAYVGARFLASPLVGALVDRMGSRALLGISCVLMPFIPLGWKLTGNFGGVLLMQVFGGFVWAAFDLCVFTYLTESTSPALRQRAFALRHVAWGLSAAGGALLGGFLIRVFGGFSAAFWASAGFRLLAALVAVWALGLFVGRPAADEETRIAA